MSRFFIRLGIAVLIPFVSFCSLILSQAQARAATAIELTGSLQIDVDGSGRILVPQPGGYVAVLDGATILDSAQTDLDGIARLIVPQGGGALTAISGGSGEELWSPFAPFSPIYFEFVRSVSAEARLQDPAFTLSAPPVDFESLAQAVRDRGIEGTGAFTRNVWIKAIRKNRAELINDRFYETLRTLNASPVIQSFWGRFAGDNSQLRARALEILRPDCDPQDRDDEHCHLKARLESQFLTFLLNNPVIALDPPAPIEELPPESKPPVPSFALLYKVLLDNILLQADLSLEGDRRLARSALRSVRTFNRQLQEPAARPEYAVITTVSNGTPQVGSPFTVTVTATNTGVRSEEDFLLLVQAPTGVRLVDADPATSGPIAQVGSLYAAAFSPLDSGESRAIALTAVADRVSEDDLSWKVFGGAGDNDARDNSGTVLVRPQPASGLSVRIESPTEIVLGEAAEFTAKVRNDSILPPDAVTVTVRITNEPSGASTVIKGTTSEGGEIVAVRETEVVARFESLRPQDEVEVRVTVVATQPGVVTADTGAEGEFLALAQAVAPAVSIREREEFFVNITQPAPNTELDGPTFVLYDRSANIVRATTHLDERLLCDEQPPTGSCFFDSTGLDNGDYLLTVTGYRQDGQTVSDSITVFVDNGTRFIEDPLRPNPVRVTSGSTVIFGGQYDNSGRSEEEVEIRFTTDACRVGRQQNCTVRTAAVRQDGDEVAACVPFDSDGGISCLVTLAAGSVGRVEVDVTPLLTPVGVAAGGATMNWDLSLFQGAEAGAGQAVTGSTDIDPLPADCLADCASSADCCLSEPNCAAHPSCGR